MEANKLITIPSPDFELNQYVSYKGITVMIKSRLYDLDKGEWLYRFDNFATYITKEEITGTGVSWN